MRIKDRSCRNKIKMQKLTNFVNIRIKQALCNWNCKGGSRNSRLKMKNDSPSIWESSTKWITNVRRISLTLNLHSSTGTTDCMVNNGGWFRIFWAIILLAEDDLGIKTQFRASIKILLTRTQHLRQITPEDRLHSPNLEMWVCLYS